MPEEERAELVPDLLGNRNRGHLDTVTCWGIFCLAGGVLNKNDLMLGPEQKLEDGLDLSFGLLLPLT